MSMVSTQFHFGEGRALQQAISSLILARTQFAVSMYPQTIGATPEGWNLSYPAATVFVRGEETATAA